MSQTKNANRRIVLNSRPIGAPNAENFRLQETPIPVPAEGELLLRTVYLSLDPYMRMRMSDAPSYAAPTAIGEVMVGGTVSRVEASNHPNYHPGEMVAAYSGWQDYAVSDGSGLIKFGAEFSHPSYALGVLGMPGFTAYMGLLEIGQPKEGETVVVAAATGAVGSAVGQIAKLKGCRVVGIAGGVEKCRYALDELGFDACIDHRSVEFPQQLAAACREGIDVYYENVGGPVFEAVMPLLNVTARVPVCGLIAHYNATNLPQGPNRLPLLMSTLLSRRIKMQGFIIYEDFGHRFDEFLQNMLPWVTEGKVKSKEDILDGLENAPKAFIGLLEGKNFGKLLIRVANE